MSTGVLRNAFNDRGFTFIQPSADSGLEGDVFLHIRSLASGEDSKLFVKGAVVEFTVEVVNVKGTEKAQARGATLIEGAPAPSTPDAEIVQRDLSGHIKFWHANGY